MHFRVFCGLNLQSYFCEEKAKLEKISCSVGRYWDKNNTSDWSTILAFGEISVYAWLSSLPEEYHAQLSPSGQMRNGRNVGPSSCG